MRPTMARDLPQGCQKRCTNQSVSLAIASLILCIPVVDEGLVVQESLHPAAVVLLRHVAAAKGGGKLIIFGMTSACIGRRSAS